MVRPSALYARSTIRPTSWTLVNSAPTSIGERSASRGTTRVGTTRTSFKLSPIIAQYRRAVMRENETNKGITKNQLCCEIQQRLTTGDDRLEVDDGKGVCGAIECLSCNIYRRE